MESRHLVDNDVTLTFDSDVWEIEAQPRRRGPPPIVGGLTGGIVSSGEGGEHDAGIEWLVSRLRSQPGVSARSLPSLSSRPGATTRALDRATAPEIKVDLAENEGVALLVESDGVVAWQFPDSTKPLPGAPPGGMRAIPGAPVRQARFTVVAPGGATASSAQKRNVFADWMLGRVKAVVLKFIAQKAGSVIVELLERNKRTGPVILSSATDPAQWEKPADFSTLQLGDEPAHILLFVHGTFSSTVGGFGDLCATAWGKALLAEAHEKYDALIGYDHRTLSVDPLENAKGLYQALRTLKTTALPTIDIVCHSRGGLVARTLIEKILPGASWKPRIGRVVFAGSTNAGTELARPENWHSLIDLMTNLALAGKKALSILGAPQAAMVAGELVDGIGDFVGYLVDAAVKDKRAPGLAAMDPGGDFVHDINLAEPNAPTPEEAQYYAIESNFQAVVVDANRHEPKEFPRRLALMLANGFIDALMKKARNDLVVNVDSMTSIDQVSGSYVKAVKDYGTNPLVYHTNYFIQPETVDSLAQWLELASPGAVDAVDSALLDRNIVVVDAGDVVEDVVRAAHEQAVSYVVIRRTDPHGPGILHYAPSIAEVDGIPHTASHVRIGEALQLHEWHQSPTLRDGRLLRSLDVQGRFDVDPKLPTFSRRAVVLDGDKPIAVLPSPGEEGALEVLARSSTPIVRQTRGGARTTPPADESPVHEAQAKLRQPEERKVPVICRALAEMPAQVRVGSGATVTVTLSADDIVATPGVESAVGLAKFEPDRPVVLEVMPKIGFELKSAEIRDSRVEFPHPPIAGKPWIVDVDVVATNEGPGEVWAIVRQGPIRAITLILRPQIVAADAAVGDAALARRGAFGAIEDLPDVATLEILQQRNGDETRFRYNVDIPNEAFNRFESPKMEGDIAKWVESLYKGIESAWLGSAGNRAIFHDSLKAKGATLFTQLIPPPLKDLLWRLHLQGKLKSLLVRSDEPFVPWEIAYLDDPKNAGHEKGCFFGQLGLCRWLYGSVPVPRIRIRPGRLRYVIPHYPEPRYRLPAAEQVEEPMLVNMAAQKIEPHYPQVKAALMSGEFDLLHFAGHGGAEAGSINDAVLLLEGTYQTVDGERRYVTEPLPVDNVATNAKLRGADGNRPLVLLNACQVGRIGFSLTSIGGFAPAFLGVREGESESIGEAGAFVSSLWSVGDQPASAFADAFYKALSVPGGCTIGQAVIVAREAARSAGDATWLAYAVYAHPNCRVEFMP